MQTKTRRVFRRYLPSDAWPENHGCSNDKGKIDERRYTPGTILSRIRTAAGLFASGNKMKYQGVAELYAVYLEAKVEPSKAAEIEAEYSAKGHPKTDLLTNMVLWLGFPDGADRRRISDMHLLLLECENQNKLPSELVEWFVAEGGWRKVVLEPSETNNATGKKRVSTKSAGSTGSSNGAEDEKPDNGKLFKAISAFDEEAKFQSSSEEPPIPVACDIGEYLVQICRKVGSGSFLTYWVKVTQTELEHIKTSALPQKLAEAA